jgi:FixJ family two-component response regulator
MNEVKQSDTVIYVVDDDEAIRKALSFLLRSVGYTVKTCASAKEFLETCDRTALGCVVLDVRMPGMSGMELQETMNETGIRLPVIIITGHGDVSMAVRAMKAGAVDFIEKPFENQTLLDRIADALHRCSSNWEEQAAMAEAQERLQLLTPREQETMRLLVQGKLNKQVAAELNISVRTVEAHRAKIMEKLRARSLSDLVRISLLNDS